MSVRYLLSTFISLFISLVALTACRQAADTPQEAQARLTAAPGWVLNEIYVNDALSFRDGKMINSFGNVTFDRYMERVQFNENGSFLGQFKGETQPMTLRWKVDPARQGIVVGAADSTDSGGVWTIAPVNVFEDSFEMKTESSAYDYPQITRIVLKFKKEE